MDGKENIADALTKYVGGEDTCKHIEKTGMSLKSGRHPLAPEVDEMIHAMGDITHTSKEDGEACPVMIF